jgi:hypothetical protein
LAEKLVMRPIGALVSSARRSPPTSWDADANPGEVWRQRDPHLPITGVITVPPGIELDLTRYCR